MQQYYCKAKLTMFKGQAAQIKQYHLERNVGDNSYQLPMAPAAMARVVPGMYIGRTGAGNSFCISPEQLYEILNYLGDGQYLCIIQAERITTKPNQRLLQAIGADKLQNDINTIYVADSRRFPFLHHKKPILLPKSYILHYQTGAIKDKSLYDLKSSEEFSWLFSLVRQQVA